MTTDSAKGAIVTTRNVHKSFSTADGEHLVLDDINLEVRRGEVLALLGKSGSGKSTLLRCIAGLMSPTSGAVYVGEEELIGPNERTAMVFQTFALLPWLTVQQNVELGLEARGVSAQRRAQQARRAIDLIGLDGYEDAYPKELSGGMRQRVGFARALVVEPDILLMDEPFSALDVLTAETLRNELIALLQSAEFDIASVVIVTHNIEEAVVLADRVAVLGSDPGRIRALFDINMPQPRDRDSPQFIAYVDHIYDLLTARLVSTQEEEEQSRDVRADTGEHRLSTQRIPDATVDAIAGLADILVREGRRTIANLADDIGLDVDDLFPQVDALVMLGFAEIVEGRVELNAAGVEFANANVSSGRKLFAAAAMSRIGLIASIVAALQRAKSNRLKAGFFRDTLRRHYPEADADSQILIAVDWGRYADLFTYDKERDELELEHAARQD